MKRNVSLYNDKMLDADLHAEKERSFPHKAVRYETAFQKALSCPVDFITMAAEPAFSALIRLPHIFKY